VLNPIPVALTNVSDWTIAVGIVAFSAFYICTALCLHIVAQKTGTGRPWLAWIPVLQGYLAVKIARRPDWWFVLLLLPVVNLVTGILLCGRIATIMRRSPIWGPVMVIPGLNLIPWTYLAISPAPQDLPRSDTQGLIDRWDVLIAGLTVTGMVLLSLGAVLPKERSTVTRQTFSYIEPHVPFRYGVWPALEPVILPGAILVVLALILARKRAIVTALLFGFGLASCVAFFQLVPFIDSIGRAHHVARGPAVFVGGIGGAVLIVAALLSWYEEPEGNGSRRGAWASLASLGAAALVVAGTLLPYEAYGPGQSRALLIVPQNGLAGSRWLAAEAIAPAVLLALAGLALIISKRRALASGTLLSSGLSVSLYFLGLLGPTFLRNGSSPGVGGWLGLGGGVLGFATGAVLLRRQWRSTQGATRELSAEVVMSTWAAVPDPVRLVVGGSAAEARAAAKTRVCPECARTIKAEARVCPHCRTRLGGTAAQIVAGSAETKTCPDCAETIKRAAKVCRYCGFRFDEIPDDRTRDSRAMLDGKSSEAAPHEAPDESP